MVPFILLERIDRHILRATLFWVNDLELESFLNHKNIKVQGILKLYVDITIFGLIYKKHLSQQNIMYLIKNLN